MVKRLAVMFATGLIALGVGIGAGLLPANQGIQARSAMAVWCYGDHQGAESKRGHLEVRGPLSPLD